jgi:DNA invertase Pin-like site-specific DNA recombinase
MESTKTVRVALYARVSTINHGQDAQVQTRELQEYASRRGWTVVGEYVDTGISGAREKRPELDGLMSDAHRRRFDMVAVLRFDRFARSVSHLLRALETFNALGIEFVSLSEQMDTSTPAGRMVFTVLGAVAELERSLIAERVRAGLRNARAKGKRLGRPRVYADASRIATLRAQGASWATICSEVGVSKGTAQRAFYAVPKVPAVAAAPPVEIIKALAGGATYPQVTERVRDSARAVLMLDRPSATSASPSSASKRAAMRSTSTSRCNC